MQIALFIECYYNLDVCIVEISESPWIIIYFQYSIFWYDNNNSLQGKQNVTGLAWARNPLSATLQRFNHKYYLQMRLV